MTSFAKLAELAHEAMTLTKQSQFSGVADMKSMAHPGFTGCDYDFGGSGTLVIGMNRGGSGASTIDAIENRSLKTLAISADEESYKTLSSRSLILLNSWNLWNRNLLLLFSRVGVSVNTIAYIHAVPFRVNDNATLKDLYPQVWNDFTVRQVAALNPGRILFAGKIVGEALQSLVSTPVKIVPRTGRDIARPNHNGNSHARAVAIAHDSISADDLFWNK